MVHAVVARSRQAGPSQRVDPPVNPIPIESPCRRTSRRAARQSKHRDARPPLDRAAISWADSAMCRPGASGRAPAVGKDAGAPGLGEESCGTGEVGLSTSRPAGRLVCSGSVQARCLSIGEATERRSLPVSSLPHLVQSEGHLALRQCAPELSRKATDLHGGSRVRPPRRRTRPERRRSLARCHGDRTCSLLYRRFKSSGGDARALPPFPHTSRTSRLALILRLPEPDNDRVLAINLS